MNKEKILESSRRENKNRDLAEMEVTAQAGNIAGRVGAAVCVVLTLIFRIFTKTYFLSPWVVYFSILTAALRRSSLYGTGSEKAQPIFVDCALVFLIIDRSGLYRTVCTVKTRLKSQSRPYRSY